MSIVPYADARPSIATRGPCSSRDVAVVCWGIGSEAWTNNRVNTWRWQAMRMVPGALYGNDPSFFYRPHGPRTERQNIERVAENSRFGGRRSLVGTGVLDIATSDGQVCALIDPDNNPHDTDPIVCCK